MDTDHDTSGLTPANQNPWYILMTLHGEQEGAAVDRELAEKNVRAWNAWATAEMAEEDLAAAIKSSDISDEEQAAWPDLRNEIDGLFAAQWRDRNPEKPAPGRPDPADAIDLSEIAFSNTVVLEKAIFPATAWFDRATFRATADFSGATFRAAASFFDATFRADASFFRATFHATAFFSDATFHAAARFGSATFAAAVTFAEADFTQERGERARGFDLTDAEFAKPLNLRAARFRHIYPALAGTSLPAEVSVTCDPAYWPEIGVGMPGRGHLRAPPPPEVVSRGRASCAKLRHALQRQGLPEEEMFFFRREMWFAGWQGSLVERLPYWLFGLFSGYGHSIAIPALWLWIFTWLPAIAYSGRARDSVDGLIAGFWEPVAFSVTNLFKFLGLQRTYFPGGANSLPGWAEAIAGAQTIAGVILLFFLGLGLRARFRLR